MIWRSPMFELNAFASRLQAKSTELSSAIERAARWGNLRVLGNAPAVKASILMPLFGYLILMNARIWQWFDLHIPWLPKYYAAGHLSVGWRIMALFYGTMLLAIGSALYSLFCPRLIKRYAAPVDYAASEQDFHWPQVHYKQLILDIEELGKTLPAWHKSLPGLQHLQDVAASAGFKHDEAQAREDITVFLRLLWEVDNTRRYWFRVAVLVCFVIGSLLVVVPSIVTAIRAALVTFHIAFR